MNKFLFFFNAGGAALNLFTYLLYPNVENAVLGITCSIACAASYTLWKEETCEKN
jgi:hypothetical protein